MLDIYINEKFVRLFWVLKLFWKLLIVFDIELCFIVGGLGIC